MLVARGRWRRSLWRSCGVVLGAAMVVAGVLLHLPDLTTNHGKHAGIPMRMTWTPMMLTGMFLLVTGVVMTTVVLFAGRRGAPAAGAPADVIEHGEMRPIYWVTCAALIIAMVVDTMKPLTIGFVMPGMAEEYGISISTVSILPLVALTGTVIGSAVWGFIGDRYGRRPAFLLATVVFMATSACGAMPTFEWNLVMCFVMGISAGGMLPMVFTLLAELAPRRHRGWMMVTIGAGGGLAGYLVTSTAAHELESLFTWRALWLIGLPTGLLLLVLMPLIPESPPFLLRCGRRAEAQLTLARYGARLIAAGVPAPTSGDGDGLRGLLRGRRAITVAIGLIGLSWGVVNFGFLATLPAQLGEAGLASTLTSEILARAAVYSAPGLLAVVALYAVWSSRGTLILFVLVAAVGLGGVAVWSVAVTSDELLMASVGTLVLGLAAVNAILVPYSTEICPTAFRARAAGLTAASTKLGGVLGPSTMLVMIRATDGHSLSTLAIAATGFGLLSLVGAVVMFRCSGNPGRTQ